MVKHDECWNALPYDGKIGDEAKALWEANLIESRARSEGKVKKYLPILLFPTVTLANNLSPDGMTQVMSGVDDKAVSVEMGHTFPWLDQVFTHAWMSTNGFV